MAALESELMTPVDAARALHIKVSTIRAWILNKRISYVKVGGLIRFRTTDIEDFITARVVPANAAR